MVLNECEGALGCPEKSRGEVSSRVWVKVVRLQETLKFLKGRGIAASLVYSGIRNPQGMHGSQCRGSLWRATRGVE